MAASNTPVRVVKARETRSGFVADADLLFFSPLEVSHCAFISLPFQSTLPPVLGLCLFFVSMQNPCFVIRCDGKSTISSSISSRWSQVSKFTGQTENDQHDMSSRCSFSPCFPRGAPRGMRVQSGAESVAFVVDTCQTQQQRVYVQIASGKPLPPCLCTRGDERNNQGPELNPACDRRSR